jgi:hypothetical protein
MAEAEITLSETKILLTISTKNLAVEVVETTFTEVSSSAMVTSTFDLAILPEL